MNISKNDLKPSHKFADCVYWDLFILVPVISACVGIAKSSKFWLVAYILLSIAVFFVVVYKFFCTHCPHYIKESGSLKCMFFWGLPKYFKPQPGPYTSLELIVMTGSILIWAAFPLLWLHAHGDLLAVYVLSLVVLVLTLRRYECGRCIHFDCPGNKVPGDVRHDFFEEHSQAKEE